MSREKRRAKREKRNTKGRRFLREIQFIVLGLLAGIIIGAIEGRILLGATIGMLSGVVLSEFFR